MNPPIPSAWFGLAFFFGIAATAVITRTNLWCWRLPSKSAGGPSGEVARGDVTRSLLGERSSTW